MGQLQQLYKLQQIDTEVQEKTDRLRTVLAAQKGNVAIQEARKEVETAVFELQQWQTEHKKVSQELASLNQKAKNSENRLYSGKVTNPKELADLQSELDSLSRRREAVEEELLEAMIMLEDAQTAQESAAKLVAKLEADWATETASLKQEQNELALRLHALGGLRKQHLPTIKTDLLTEYDYLIKRKRGTAVAKLRVNQCLACQLTVSAKKAKAVKEGQLVNCGSCGRILCPA